MTYLDPFVSIAFLFTAEIGEQIAVESPNDEPSVGEVEREFSVAGAIEQR
jgi:hypothetical protein